jgi:hypothetical protein
VQVVDLAGGSPVLRGKVELPADGMGYYGYYGWGGYGWYDWYDGAGVVQVGSDALAFRRVQGGYDADGAWKPQQSLTVVDLSDADSPRVASTDMTREDNGWWGNLRAVGGNLYASHMEWVDSGVSGSEGRVKYYVDRIDLSDRSNPTIGSSINVPGFLVGASETDPSLIYTVDYRWNGSSSESELAILELGEDRATLRGSLGLEGWVGNVLVRGETAYATVYGEKDGSLRLHAVDLSDPTSPVDRASEGSPSWGWLLGVEGDRAILTSGWGGAGVDIFKLEEGKAPAFDQFVRTRGWWPSSLAREGQRLYLSSGYWGVQTIDLN